MTILLFVGEVVVMLAAIALMPRFMAWAIIRITIRLPKRIRGYCLAPYVGKSPEESELIIIQLRKELKLDSSG